MAACARGQQTWRIHKCTRVPRTANDTHAHTYTGHMCVWVCAYWCVMLTWQHTPHMHTHMCTLTSVCCTWARDAARAAWSWAVCARGQQTHSQLYVHTHTQLRTSDTHNGNMLVVNIDKCMCSMLYLGTQGGYFLGEGGLVPGGLCERLATHSQLYVHTMYPCTTHAPNHSARAVSKHGAFTTVYTRTYTHIQMRIHTRTYVMYVQRVVPGHEGQRGRPCPCRPVRGR